MKVFVAIFSVVCTLVLPSKLLASDWFDIFISRDTVELKVGQTSTLTINFIQHDATFDASLLLGAGIGDYKFLDVDGTWKKCLEEVSGVGNWLRNPPMLDFSTNSVNKPYNPVTCTIKSNQADTGIFQISINIYNNNRIAKDTIYVKVIPMQMQNWYSLKLIPVGSNKPVFPACLFVTEDTSIHNYYLPTHEQTIGTGNIRRRIIYTGADEYIDAIPITTFAFNKKRQMWIDGNKGLQKIDRNYITTYNSTNSAYKGKINSNYYYSIFAEDSSGNEYLTNYGGLYSIKDGLVTDLTLQHSDLFNQLTIGSLYINQRSNSMYVSTRRLGGKNNIGLYRYDGNRWDSIEIKIQGISNDSIITLFDIKQDAANNIYALVWYFRSPETYKQLVMYDGNKWIQFPALDSIPLKGNSWFNYEPHMIKFEFDMHGDIWLISGSKQLVQFDGKIVKKIYNSENSPIWIKSAPPFFFIDSSNTFYFPSGGNEEKYLQMFNPDGIPLPLMSQPSAVEEEIQPPISGITISPNPSSTSVTISGIEGIRSVQLVNTLGMVVDCEVLGATSTYEIDVSNLPNGMYSIQFRTETGIISKPVVVNR